LAPSVGGKGTCMASTMLAGAHSAPTELHILLKHVPPTNNKQNKNKTKTTPQPVAAFCDTLAGGTHDIQQQHGWH
jgi:hypothetical protein